MSASGGSLKETLIRAGERGRVPARLQKKGKAELDPNDAQRHSSVRLA